MDQWFRLDRVVGPWVLNDRCLLLLEIQAGLIVGKGMA
jgi:hypothetical protein